MIIFLIFYFLALCLFQIFLYLKLSIFITFSSYGKIIYILISILFIFLPIISRFLEKNNFSLLPKIFLCFFYFYLAYLFIFFFFGLITIPLNFFQSLEIISNRILFFIPFFIIIFGFFQDKFILVKKFEIKSKKIKKTIKVGFISDLHLGLTQGKNKLKKIVKILKNENIDILLSGGDFLDSSYLNDNTDILKNFNPPLGKYAVLGNHEWYVGVEKSTKILENFGFKLLRFESFKIDGNILVAGADDETTKYFKENYNEEEFLRNLKEDSFIIYLRHRPPKEKIEKVNLILSGHTHKGQFFPFSLITSLFFKYHSGFYKINEDSYIYVSSGAGSWGPPIRFLTLRDLSIFDLKPE